ncbi:hypothetical protein ASE11_07535 [Hydrogenophaga sp. Root209]|nr:hypothetical protein ASE11_07535 [Hydrogenophaga sp. Root209]
MLAESASVAHADLKEPSMNNAFAPRAKPLPAPSRHQIARLLALTALTALTLVLMACATKTPAPTQELALSRVAVETAARAGAAELAPTELNIARQKQALAEAAMSQQQYDRALLLSDEVQVDARLAEVKARSNRADKAATELREDGRALRQEIERTAPR